MGWLFMRSLGGHATLKAYLDDQFTYAREDRRSRVLASGLVAMRTYYAAVEHVTVSTGAREVWALGLPGPIQSPRPGGLCLWLQGHGGIHGPV